MAIDQNMGQSGASDMVRSGMQIGNTNTSMMNGSGVNRTWEMQGNVQGSGMPPMVSRQMQPGGEENDSNGASKQIKAMKERKRAAHKAKREKYESTKREAGEDLTRLSGGMKVNGDKESLKKALSFIMRNRSYDDAAEAIIAAIDCRWGCCEKETEDVAREAARSVEEDDMD